MTWADWGILIGSFGWFGMYFLLFARTFPVVAIQEIKEMIPYPRKHEEGTDGGPDRPRRAGLVRPRGFGGRGHHRLKAKGFRDLTVYSPNHEIEEALDHPVSWVGCSP